MRWKQVEELSYIRDDWLSSSGHAIIIRIFFIYDLINSNWFFSFPSLFLIKCQRRNFPLMTLPAAASWNFLQGSHLRVCTQRPNVRVPMGVQADWLLSVQDSIWSSEGQLANVRGNTPECITRWWFNKNCPGNKFVIFSVI